MIGQKQMVLSSLQKYVVDELKKRPVRKHVVATTESIVSGGLVASSITKSIASQDALWVVTQNNPNFNNYRKATHPSSIKKIDQFQAGDSVLE